MPVQTREHRRPLHVGTLARLCVTGLLLTGMSGSAAEPEPGTDISEMELLCKGIELRPSRSPSSEPRFTIDRLGTVKLSKKKTSPSMAFDLGGPHDTAWIQVERVTPTGVRNPVACGPVEHGVSYRLPGLEIDVANERDRLVVRLFDLPRGAAEQARLQSVREEREKVLLFPAFVDRELAALRKWADVKVLTDVVKEFMESPSPDQNQENAVREAMKVTRGFVDQLGAVCRNGGSGTSEPGLLKKICEEQNSLGEKLKVVGLAFERYSVAMKAPARKELLNGLRDALQDAAGFLMPGELPEEKAREAHCAQFAILNWLNADKTAHLVAKVELPLVEGKRIVEAMYGEGESVQDIAYGQNAPLAVLLHDVPLGVELGVGTRQVISEPKGIADVLAGVFTFLVQIMTSGQNALMATTTSGVGAVSHQYPVFIPEWPTLICLDTARSRTTADTSSEGGVKVTLKVDAEAPPLALSGTRTFDVEPVDKGARREIYVCDSQLCAPSKDNAKVRNRLILDSDHGSSFPLLVEFAGTAAMEGQGGFTTPRYMPLGGRAGPQRVYELRGDYRTQDLASISVLFGWRMSRRLTLALGPSLLIGTSGGTFSQVGLRLGYEFARGAFVTTGPSLRFVQTATKEAPLGSRIAVANGEDPKLPAPPGLEYQPRLGWSVGLAVDASAVADAGKSLLKSVGVAQ